MWVPQPASVVAVRVCRISGLRAVDGCAHVPDVDREGEPIEKSMVTTAYFRRGTEPLEYCLLHGEEDGSIRDRQF